MTTNLGARAVAGGRVVAITQFLRFGLQILGMIALSWLVSPADFGLVAVVVAVLGSSVSGDPRLTGIAIALSTSIVLNAAQPQFQAQLLRELRFERVALTELASVGIGIMVGVLQAAAGAGYWALVGQVIAQSASLLLLRVAASDFRPGRPRRGVEMRGLLTFGANLAGSQLLVYLSSNLDTIMMGMRYSAASVGQYRRASQLVSLPLAQLMTPLTSVAVAALSRCLGDSVRLWGYFRRAQIVTAYPATIALAVGALNAEWMVTLLFGTAWQATAGFIQILCIAGVLQITSYPLYWAFLALGRTRDHFVLSMISRSILVASVAAGSLCGEFGVPIGYVVGVAIGWPIGFWRLGRAEQRRLSELIAVPARAAAVALIMIGAGWLSSLLAGGGHVASEIAGTTVALLLLGLLVSLNSTLRGDVLFVVRNLIGRLRLSRRGEADA